MSVTIYTLQKGTMWALQMWEKPVCLNFERNFGDPYNKLISIFQKLFLSLFHVNILIIISNVDVNRS